MATPYAKTNRVWVGDNGNSWWWLRSPGDSQDLASSVDNYGYVDTYGVDVLNFSNGVRPALWINNE